MKSEFLHQEALTFVKELVEQYFVQRDLENLPQFMSKDISWIGTGEDEISKSLSDATQALEKELVEYNGSFSLHNLWFDIASSSDSLCVIYGTIHAVPNDSALSDENLRLTVAVEISDCGMKLVHLHMSHPDRDQEHGHYFISKTARSSARDLQRTLELRNRQLDILNINIPGGAHQCKNDPNFTIITMSDSFLSMFGYSRNEVESLFHNHFIEMVYPGDRASMLNSTYEQLKNGSDIELEYRVMCKNGTPVWVLDKGRLIDDGSGNKNFYCLLIEISERKRAQEDLRLSLERHQVIMDQATDIIFEWDICEDTLSFSPNWRKKFGYDAIDTQISENIPLSKNIHPDDISAFVKIMKDTAAGIPFSEAEFRINDINGKYYWCRIRATAQFDSDGRPIKAVGVIADIDNEKKQKQALLDMAQRDALTGLYNKATINSLVERRMTGNEAAMLQALFILDVDNFKLVNDRYGHLVGDSLLSEVAVVIKSHIRSTDLAGRIGGDEFLVYLPEVSNEEAAMAKANTLLEALEQITPGIGLSHISCSIGVAVSTRGEIDYRSLYKHADLALYARKNNGRSGVTFYSTEFEDKALTASAPRSAISGSVGSDDGTVSDEKLAQYVFRMLYSANEIEPTVNRLLEIIGRSYDVSRAYIFESSDDKTMCSNTFEWCADGIEPQLEQLQNISYIDDLGDYLKNFNENGIFYCGNLTDTHPDVRAVLEPQGIRSMLQCAMLDEGEFVGYVGFDECRENRAWSSQQAATFKLTADVLSSFVVKLRQKQKLKKLLNA